MQQRISHYTSLLGKLISAQDFCFNNKLRKNLPEKPGIYRILEGGASWDSSLRVGRTDAQNGLRQRVYRNHFMGSQSGNIKAQLVKAGRFSTQNEAKDYLSNSCRVQFIVVENEDERKWLEHFIISVLQPQFSD